ncbi:HAD family phosphatase [Corynebacterium sp. 13CS0277]|uniref:HAD family hydrolase n=1 Tax=Corynebacterium sp. 13CS0277 TaxID=2071994 RepID=UPI001E4108E2|nr:HAD family hydrolase [Corynebacterium sp. 13CS0277]
MSRKSLHCYPASGAGVAAFFDLDKTIIAKSSAFAFSRQFLADGLISPAMAVQMSFAQAAYMLHGHSEDKMDATRDQLAAMVAGWDVTHVRQIAFDTLHTVVTPAIYAEARDLIASHQAAGHRVIIVSASAMELVAPIAAELGADEVIATRLEIVDGRYTGTVVEFMKGPAKQAAVRQAAARLGLEVAHCFAYSDSATDIPMLSSVGNPVAVNPDRPLRKHAVEHGWPVLVLKNPVPLFAKPTRSQVGVSTAAVAALAAVAGTWWWSRRLL